MNAVTGMNVPTTPNSGAAPSSRAAEIRSLGSAAAPAASTKPAAEPSLGSRVGTDLSTAGGNAASTLQDDSKPTVVRGLEATNDVAGGAISAAAETLPQPVREAAGAVGKAGGDIVSWLGEKLGSTKMAQDFVTQHPDAAKTLSQYAEGGQAAGGLAGDILGAEGGATAGAKSIDLGKAGVSGAKNVVASSAANSTAQATADAAAKAAATGKANLADAISRSTPDFESMNPTQKSNLINQSVKGQPRVVENTKLGGKRTVTPNSKEIAAGTELSKVPGYDSKMTNLQIHNLGKAAIAGSAKTLESSLEGEKILVPPKEIMSVVKKAVAKVPNESLVLSKADPAIKQYLRVTQNAIEKSPGNLKGVLQVRKLMDTAYNNAKGKLAFSPDKISSLDEVHTAARDALNEHLIKTARSTPAEALLKSQSNIYKALDEVGRRATREAGSKAGRFVQQHPTITKIGRTAATVGGFGAAIHLMP